MEIANPKKYLFIAVLMMISIFLFNGCASSGSIEIQKPLTTKLRGYQTLAIDCSSNVPTSEDSLNILRGLVIEKIRKKNIFQRVFSRDTSIEENSDLTLTLTIVHFDEVTDWDQAGKGFYTTWGYYGAMIDPALMNVIFELSDENSGTLLSSGTAKVEMTDWMADKIRSLNIVSDQIALYIIKNR